MRTEYWQTWTTVICSTLALAPIPLQSQPYRINVSLVGSARVGEVDPSSYASDLEVVGQYAYVAAWQRTAEGLGSLELFDVSDPRNPTSVGRYETDHPVWGVRVRGDFAFLTGSATSGSNYFGLLEVVNVSDPTMPRRVGAINTAEPAGRLEVFGSYG